MAMELFRVVSRVEHNRSEAERISVFDGDPSRSGGKETKGKPVADWEKPWIEKLSELDTRVEPLEQLMTEALAYAVAHLPADLIDREQRQIQELAASGAAQGLAVGDPAPDFTLPSLQGATVRLADALAGGPVALSFYRGYW